MSSFKRLIGHKALEARQNIAKREVANNQLSEYQSAIEGAEEMIAILDRGYRFVVVNRAFLDFRNLQREQVVGKRVAEILGEDFFDQNLRDHIDRSFEGNVVRFEARCSCADRCQRDLAISCLPIDASPAVDRIVCILQDVTERRKTEEALRDSEARFRRVVQNIGDAVIIDDVDGNVTFANDRFLSLFEITSEELPTVRLEDYVSPDHHAEIRERHDRRMQGEAMPTHFTFQGRKKNGTHMWLEADVVPIRGADGVLQGTQSTLRDITARKEAEGALRESEERFRKIANSAPVMIWMADKDGRYTYINKPLVEFTGGTSDLNLPLVWSNAMNVEDAQNHDRLMRESVESGEPFTTEYRLKRYDGEYRWIVETAAPRFDPDGSLSGFIGSCVDDTDRRLASEAIRNISGRLIEAQEEERKRIARELHDNVNQRLAMVAFELQRLQDDSHMSAVERNQQLHKLLRQTTQISSEVQTLSHTLHSATIEYLGLVPAIQGFCDELARQHKVSINFSHSTGGMSFPADVSLALFRVSQEALQNAVKYSGVKEFDVELRVKGHVVQLRVHDAGAGFVPDNLVYGPGLGLISMRERMAALNGTVLIASQPNGGTEIIASAPLERRLPTKGRSEI